MPKSVTGCGPKLENGRRWKSIALIIRIELCAIFFAQEQKEGVAGISEFDHTIFWDLEFAMMGYM